MLASRHCTLMERKSSCKTAPWHARSPVVSVVAELACLALPCLAIITNTGGSGAERRAWAADRTPAGGLMVARGPEQRCVLTNTAVGDGSTRQVSGPRSTADDDWRRSDKCPAWVMKQKINRVGGIQPCEDFRVESEESKVEEFQAGGNKYEASSSTHSSAYQ